MENASKALIMAGSVLLSMLIIGALVFMFNNLRQVKQGELTSEEIKKQVEYNKKIETFNRSLYGSELISLANFIADYEKRADIGSETAGYNQYDPIKLTVTLKTPISDTRGGTTYTGYQELLNDFNGLNSEIQKWKEGKKSGYFYRVGNTKITAEKISGMRDTELTQWIQQVGGNNITATNLRDFAQTYSDLKLELTNFKNRRFQITKVVHSPDNNRITQLVYNEI